MSAAEAQLTRIVARVQADLPDGIGPELLDAFVARHRATLLALLEADDAPPTTVARRTEANLAAMAVLARTPRGPLSDADRAALARYTGWGGLSLERVRDRIPAGVAAPEPRALLHEYYTPVAVTDAVAELVRPLLPGLTNRDGTVPALEPSAGIGRFVQSMSGPGFERLRWSLVEIAPTAARILEARFAGRPEVVQITRGAFEDWVRTEAPAVSGSLQLVVANPPYGPRGDAITRDPDRRYRDPNAYAYFLRRGLDLLAPGGLGIYLVPAGFLTGTGAAATALRRQVLAQHHLSAAFRLPSSLFPGALLVTDLLVFRARAAPLDARAIEEDVLAGGYYRRFAEHVLGAEVKKGARFGYQIAGDFTGLPRLVERPWGRREALRASETPPASAPPSREPAAVPSTSADAPPARSGARADREAPRAEAEPPVDPGAEGSAVDEAVALGRRVDRFFAAVAQGDPEAPGLWGELTEALTAWVATHGPPARHRALRKARTAASEARALALTRFVTAFAPDGALVDALRTAPEPTSRFPGSARDVVAQAEWLYRQRRRLTAAELLRFHRSLGGPHRTRKAVVAAVLAAGWACDGPPGGEDQLVPGDVFLTGDLWPKIERARARGRQGDALALVQLDRLLEALGTVAFDDLVSVGEDGSRNLSGISPRQGWVPLSLVQEWMSEALNFGHPVELERRDGLVVPKALDYDQLGKTAALSPEAQWCLGWINHDKTVFKPRREEVAGEMRKESYDQARFRVAEAWELGFFTWLEAEESRRRRLTDAYHRHFRGYRAPTYRSTPLAIARWNTAAVRLHEHQNAGARRLVANRGGLLAFDVGVGKTYTALAAIARARQEGWCRRPVVVVPNSIVWKWAADVQRVLPDYRVAVIGLKRTVAQRGERKGQLTERPDTPDERARKWTALQAGRLDLVLVTYTALARTALDPIQAKAHADATSAIRRSIRLTQRNLRGKSELTERQEALLAEGSAAWLAKKLELPDGWAFDPGIVWDDLGIDLLVVDEAQNFKNLYMPGDREGGVPRFMGNAGEGSDRAWQLDLRAAAVRRHTGGSGIVLLSATPAKNSPLELYNLIQYIDPTAWTARGIHDPEQFVDRYLRIELKPVVDSTLEVRERAAVTGFLELPELRDVLFQYGEFKTAEDVNLALPTPTVEVVEVDLDAEQAEKSARYIEQIERSLDDRQAQGAILGLLARLALVAIHPKLDEGLDWRSAGRFDPHSPKLDAMAEAVVARPGCGHLVFVDNVVVHRWAKEVLVQAGIAADRIAILNAKTTSPGDRQRIALAFNGDPERGVAPEFDVVIANAVAYEGIDLQTRTCAIHHLDLPWEPATLQQRNGRGVRQGNTLGAIAIRYYFARRSQDGLRFSLIQGKLGWMQELLQSQKRDTNNPGAHLELGPEEILLLVSRDPEQTKARLQAVKARRAEEARQRMAAGAEQLLMQANARFREAERATDLTKAARLREDAEARLDSLTKVDPDAWPWVPWALAVREGPVWVPAKGWPPVSDGLRVRLRSDRDGPRFVEFGRVTDDGAGVREAGTARWVHATGAQLAGWAPTVDDLLADWPDGDAAATLEAARGRLELAGRHLEWPELGWRAASQRWLAALWRQHGADLVERLAAVPEWWARRQRVPVRTAAGELALAQGTQIREGEVLAPTEDGWRAFLALGRGSDHPFAELAAAATYWWDRRVPRTLRGSTEPDGAS